MSQCRTAPQKVTTATQGCCGAVPHTMQAVRRRSVNGEGERKIGAMLSWRSLSEVMTTDNGHRNL